MTLDYAKVWESMNSLESVTSKICSAREILNSAIDALENKNGEKAETLMYATDEFLKYYLAEFDEKFKIAWKETVSKLHKENEDHYNTVLREKEYYEPSMPPWGHSDLEYGLANPTLTQDRNSNFPGENTICDKDDPSPECEGAWTSFWEEHYYPEEYSSSQYTEEEMSAMCAAAENDKVVRWHLPVECDGPSGEYYITFPDDLLEAANLEEGEEVEWIDNGDGSFILRKTEKGLPTHKELMKNGYMTYEEAVADGWTMTADGFWIKE
jgi:bifunctional DNA-binding transcriptional regulator/antitoxin component of YhaV-PrlF toxin-antitoxin module